MSASRLAHLIATRNATPEDLARLAADAFSADLLHFVNANNEQPLADAVAVLPMGKAQVKGKQNKAIGDAIAQGLKACRGALPDGAGWVGAVHGSFSKASKEARTPYLSAHAVGVQAFADSLASSGAFVSVTLTPEEKAAKKAEREEKAATAQAEATKATIDAMVASGELVKRENVHALSDYAPSALLSELLTMAQAGKLTPDDVATLGEVFAMVDATQQAAA